MRKSYSLSIRLTLPAIFALLFNLSAFAGDNSLFFKVEKNGIVSYILGTMHSHNISLESLNPKILEALNQSERVLVESDMGIPRPESAREASIRLERNGKSLSKQLSPGANRKLKQYVSSLEAVRQKRILNALESSNGIGALAYYIYDDHLVWRSEARAKFFPDSDSEVYGGKNQESVLDEQLAERAFVQGKKVVSLDLDNTLLLGFYDNYSLRGLNALLMTLDPLPNLDFVDRFENLPMEYQESTRPNPETEKVYVTMREAFLRNDPKSYFGMLPWLSKINEVEESISMVRRDIYWMNYIQNTFSTYPSFMAVGMVHLFSYGPTQSYGKSVIDRLRENGFIVTPVPLLCEGLLKGEA